jgi:hypothetical protein
MKTTEKYKTHKTNLKKIIPILYFMTAFSTRPFVYNRLLFRTLQVPETLRKQNLAAIS